MKPSKCVLISKQVEFLGRLVSEPCVAPLPDEVESVKDWLGPDLLEMFVVYLSLLLNYCRRDFASVVLHRPNC